MRFAPLLALAALAAACIPLAPATPARPAIASSTADADEMAVMALVVDSVLAQPNERFLVLADSTSPSHLDAEQLANFVPALDSASRAELMRDFLAKNAAPGPTPASIPATSVIRISNVSRIFAGDGDFSAKWEAFFTRFAPARAYNTLSRPGFDAPRRNAVVATGTICGGRCGQGRLIVLEKTGGAWRITRRVDTWIS
jgi:hypothetical protein